MAVDFEKRNVTSVFAETAMRGAMYCAYFSRPQCVAVELLLSTIKWIMSALILLPMLLLCFVEGKDVLVQNHTMGWSEHMCPWQLDCSDKVTGYKEQRRP